MRAGLLLAAACLATAGPAAAQAPLWLVGCSNQADAGVLMCETAQSIVLTESNQRLASLRFVKAAGSAETSAAVTLPLGLYLPAGVTLSAGEAEIGTAEIEACDRDGCYARLILSEGWEGDLAGTEALVAAAERQDREAISFSFPLEGFEASWALMP